MTRSSSIVSGLLFGLVVSPLSLLVRFYHLIRPNHNSPASARVYSVPLLLRVYDIVVLSLSNTYAWRCPTKEVLLPFFQTHLSTSKRHLDIGVGTGWYPAHSIEEMKNLETLVFMDVNEDTLNAARKRGLSAKVHSAGAGKVFQGAVVTRKKSCFEPLSAEEKETFDSISLFYLLHCLPTPISEKLPAILRAALPSLKPNGILYGATILGDGHNWGGRKLMEIYTKQGIFGNGKDNEEDLRRVMENAFEKVEVKRVGAVALFWGKGKKNKGL
ncbi:S-adenosyl-L-methionine dependent methyltransferase [Atractiella rhizophila]|nr:S-adenosyl-L-methionine dependent methyltransferase [Atractiella rhizophila]